MWHYNPYAQNLYASRQSDPEKKEQDHRVWLRFKNDLGLTWSIGD